jgi:hypothetical protein
MMDRIRIGKKCAAIVAIGVQIAIFKDGQDLDRNPVHP